MSKIENEQNLSNFQKKQELFNNRFVLKLFGNRDHDNIKIESERILSINKGQIDKLENKGQISQWKFEMDQIYEEDISLNDIYENEIECKDFLNGMQLQTYRNIIFIGDQSDSLREEPFLSFIRNSIQDILNLVSENNSYTSQDIITTITYYEIINNTKIINYFKDKKEIIFNPKIISYNDDIVIEGIDQISINSLEEFNSLIEISLKIYDSNYIKSLYNNITSNTEIINFRILNCKNDFCLCKINFILYKAYKLGNELNDEYKLYTKDNYNFFHSAQNKINIRLSYIMKYIKDIFINGKSLFIFCIPSELQFIILLHDLLNYIKMRKLILHNFYLDNSNEMSQLIQNVGNNSLFDIHSNINIKNNSIEKENDSAFSNTSIAEINNSISNSSFCIDNSFITGANSKERIKLNESRLMKIGNKIKVAKLFKCLDELE